MTKNGFTLVEIIAVLVIMSILLTLTVPAVLNNVDRKKRSEHDSIIEEIETSAKLYINQNKDVAAYISSAGEININYQTLVSEGLVKANQIDPLTNEQWTSESYVNVKYQDNKYITEYIEGQSPTTITLTASNITISSKETYYTNKILEAVTARDSTGKNYITAVSYECELNGAYSRENCVVVKNILGSYNIKYKLLNNEVTKTLTIN